MKSEFKLFFYINMYVHTFSYIWKHIRNMLFINSRKKTVKHICGLTLCRQSEYRRLFVFFCCENQQVGDQRSDQVCDEELRDETKKKLKASKLNIQTQTAHRAASTEENPSHLQIQVQFSSLLFRDFFFVEIFVF